MLAFLSYFCRFIVFSKTKQPLLYMATFGLVLSSFALLFLQGTMGGMQSSMIERSKKVNGYGKITFPYKSKAELAAVYHYLKEKKISYRSELVLELLVNRGQNYAPALAHGADLEHSSLSFLGAIPQAGAYLGYDLYSKVGAIPGEVVRLISPAHIDTFMGNIPRMISIVVEQEFFSEVPEVDAAAIWLPLRRLQGLVGHESVNTIYLLDEFHQESLASFLKTKTDKTYLLQTWEMENSTLLWALNLETTMMVFLFSCMCLLVSLSITSGLMIFFDKIKRDLVSFWILGKDENSIARALAIFLFSIITISILFGIGTSTVALVALDLYAPQIMPDVFVDQKIPVRFNFNMFVISFMVPLFISIFFSWFTLNSFKKETNYLALVS